MQNQSPMQHESPMQNDHESMIDPALPVAGIDVAKKQLDLFIDRVDQRLTVVNDDAGIDRLAQKLLEHQVCRVVIESTGRYHRRVAATLLAGGIRVSTVNPQQIRAFARALGKLEKSDAIDARVLAGFARAADPRVDAKPRENQTLLQDLLCRRRALVQMRVAEINRSKDPLPRLAQRQSRALLRLIDQQIEDLDREIARHIEADEDWNNKSRIIDSVPGIGPDTAHQLVIELPELGQLNRAQIAKLVGLAPLNCDSGPFRGQRHIQGGRRQVRTCLFMAAFNARLKCERFKSYFQNLIARGKQYKVAMTACMRKLLIVLNQMVKTNTSWNGSHAGELT